MDLGPEENFLKFWEVSRNRALKRFAQFLFRTGGPGGLPFGFGLGITVICWDYGLGSKLGQKIVFQRILCFTLESLTDFEW